GRPAYDDRRIEMRGDSVVATDEPIVLPYRLDFGVGARRTLRSNLAAVGEITTLFETGRRSSSLDRARPVDFMLGLQFRHKQFQMTAALRDHRNALPSMQMRPSPLAGLVDLTRVTADALDLYLDEIGFGGATPYLRRGSHRLL